MDKSDLITRWAFYVVDAQNKAFFVRGDAVKTWNKRAMIHSSATSLKAHLKTPLLDSWIGLCEPDSMVPIEVEGVGTLVFLSFKFSDADDDKRNFGKRLVQVPPAIASEALAAVHQNCVDTGRYTNANERATERLNTAKWVPSDCSQQYFDYEALGWLSVDDREGAVAAAKASIDQDGPEAVQKVIDAIDDAIQSLPTSIKLIPGKYGSGVRPPATEADAVVGRGVETDAPDGANDANGHAEEEKADAPTSLVSTGEGVPFSKTKEEVLCPQGKGLYKPLADHVELLPVITNVVTPATFYDIRDKRTAAHWKQYLHPNALGVFNVDGVQNLWTTFKVDGYDVEDKVVMPNQQIVKDVISLYAVDHAKEPVIDVSTPDGAQRLSLIFGWDPEVVDDGKQKKVVKLDGAKIAGWTKIGGNWKSPVPKPIKEAASVGPAATTVLAIPPGKRARVGAAAAAAPVTTLATTSMQFYRDEDTYTEKTESPFVAWTKFVNVGKRFRVDTDTFPGYVVLTKFHEQPLLADEEDE